MHRVGCTGCPGHPQARRCHKQEPKADAGDARRSERESERGKNPRRAIFPGQCGPYPFCEAPSERAGQHRIGRRHLHAGQRIFTHSAVHSGRACIRRLPPSGLLLRVQPNPLPVDGLFHFRGAVHPARRQYRHDTQGSRARPHGRRVLRRPSVFPGNGGYPHRCEVGSDPVRAQILHQPPVR